MSDQTIKQLQEENELLKVAITNSDAWLDGFCIVCGNHTERHSDDCVMKSGENSIQ